MSRILILIYAVLSYVLFIAVSVWTGAFLLDIANIRSNGAHTPWPIAVVIDVSLIATFGIAHSVMARAGFKRGLDDYHSTRRRTRYLFVAIVFVPDVDLLAMAANSDNSLAGRRI